MTYQNRRAPQAPSDRAPLKKVGALWKPDKDGAAVLRGEIEINGQKIKVMVFKNTFKSKPNQPDYEIKTADPAYAGGEAEDAGVPF